MSAQPKKKNLFLRILLGIVAVLLILLVVAVVFLGHTVKTSVNTVAPLVLGVPVHVEKVHASPFRGRITMHDFTVGNPEGFKTDSLVEFDTLVFDIDVPSCFSDTVRIEEITVEGFALTMEQGLRYNNLLAFLSNLKGADEKEKEEEAKEEEKEPAGGKPAKKVVIDSVDITGTRFKFALTAMMGAAVPIPLPPIHLQDIGKDPETGEAEGTSPRDAVIAVFSGIASAASTAVSGSTDAISSGLGVGADALSGLGSALGSAASATTEKLGNAASATTDAIGNAASATTDAIGNAASATTEKLGDAASTVGGAIGNAASAIGGLFGSGGDE
jgi:hypothetical protein